MDTFTFTVLRVLALFAALGMLHPACVMGAQEAALSQSGSEGGALENDNRCDEAGTDAGDAQALADVKDVADTEDPVSESRPWKTAGFLEARAGTRLWSNRYEKRSTLAEARFHVSAEKEWGGSRLRLSGDLLYDQVTDHHAIDMNEGEGWFDLREACFSTSLHEALQISAGRKILSWGSGDLLFINDLFPKDWRSFYAGRDEAYLRAPSDAVQATVSSDDLCLDLVYTPQFDADRYIDGRRLSYWNDSLGRRAGRDAPLRADYPDEYFRHDEIAMRISCDFSGYEAALYGYQGFWKYPAGEDPVTGRGRFPDLGVVGAGIEGPVAGFTGALETGYYFSKEDSGGSDPNVRNSELRFLAGLEKELFPDFMATMQYYIEWMMDHGAYARTLQAGQKKRDELRHVLSMRFDQHLMDRKVTLSLLSLVSPSDRDAYARPVLHYRMNDRFSMEFGANLWIGKDNHTYIGQYERNINVYMGVRYSF